MCACSCSVSEAYLNTQYTIIYTIYVHMYVHIHLRICIIQMESVVRGSQMESLVIAFIFCVTFQTHFPL